MAIILEKSLYKRVEIMGRNLVMKEVIFRVSSISNVKKLAGSIAHTVKGDGETVAANVVLNCCGASAVSQAVKAVAVARGFLASNGRDLVVRPGFDTAFIEGEERTVIKLFISLN